jgi:hypothetical protein
MNSVPVLVIVTDFGGLTLPTWRLPKFSCTGEIVSTGVMPTPYR